MTTSSSRRFDELANAEIEAALGERPLVVVPLGSTEQHGPHLPGGTDYFASLAIAERIVGRIGGLVLPGMQFGVTPIHMGFAGTVSLSASTFESVLYEMGASLAAHGVREVALLNWHEGNIHAIGTVASRLTQEQHLNVVVAHACYVAEELYGAKLGGLTHGGAIEAAAVLGHRPDLVHLERLARGDQDAAGERPADHARRGRAYQSVLRDIREISESGWYGSAAAVGEADGVELLDAVAAAVADELARRFERLAELRGRNG